MVPRTTLPGGADRDRDTLAVELHTATGIRSPATSEVLGCTFETVEGPALELGWSGGMELIRRF